VAYSEVADLLLGDLILSARVDKQKFINDAAEEMDAKLGFLYKTPVVIPDAEAGNRHQALLLKQINNKLASGRLILTLDIPQEHGTLHAYGLRLVKEATEELLLIANGTVDLAADRAEGGTGIVDRRPEILVYDEESLLLGFENTVLRGVPWYSRPGKVS
jgi:hypothetical protein